MIKNIENKAIKQEEIKAKKLYFIPDMNGKPVSVEAESLEEAIKKANI